MTDARMKMIKEYVITLRRVYVHMPEDTDEVNAFVDGANEALNHIMSFCNVVDDLITEVKNE